MKSRHDLYFFAFISLLACYLCGSAHAAAEMAAVVCAIGVLELLFIAFGRLWYGFVRTLVFLRVERRDYRSWLDFIRHGLRPNILYILPWCVLGHLWGQYPVEYGDITTSFGNDVTWRHPSFPLSFGRLTFHGGPHAESQCNLRH